MFPSHLLGSAPGSLPPLGTPNYYVAESQTLFTFEVRKFTPGANCAGGGSLSAAVNVSQTSYNLTLGNVVPQPGTTNKVDSIDDRPMQRVVYRRLGDVESVWVTHAVRTASTAPLGPQWAQINVTGGTINTTPVQQQIYNPDTSIYRWMPSLAVDHQGNMAIGYSTSNGTAPNYPSIAYSGRLVSDTLNQLPQTEVQMTAGNGSQVNNCGGAPCHRWGDYTAMLVDPSDDCSFWYTNEYYDTQTSGNTGNWHTRIGKFKFPTCTSGLQFRTMPPCRVFDSRGPVGPLGGPFLPGGSTRTIPVATACNIPAGAVVYSLNATVVPKTGTLGFLSLWPAGQPRPLVSTLNSLDGSILANAALVPAGSAGSVDAYVTNDTNLILDIDGYFIPPSPSVGTFQFFPMSPCRVLDTRGPVGPFGAPALSSGVPRAFPILASPCGVPGSAVAYSFNVTVVPIGPLNFLTTWPTGSPQPVVSTLNSFDGTILANAAIVPAGTGGQVNFISGGNTQLIVDVNGYFALPAPGGLDFHPVTPCRVADTRGPVGPLGGPIIGGGTSRTFPVPSSSCLLPSTAAAYSLNMTAVPPAPLGFLTVWPDGVPRPLASTLNDSKGLPDANAALVQAGTAAAIDVFVNATSHVVIDANGYFQ
jgi:hypothetical protein